MRIPGNINVPELTPAIDFYSNTLDLVLTRMIGNDAAELTGASSVFYLSTKAPGLPAGSAASEARQHSRHWTPAHLGFLAEDLIEATNRAIKAGARKESDCAEWKDSKSITFSDPFGHDFCLIEFAGDTYSQTGVN